MKKIILNEQTWQTLQSHPLTLRKQDIENSSGRTTYVDDKWRFIGNRAFFEDGKLKKLALPSNCAVIGNSAFEGSQLQKIEDIPESLILIKRRAFARNNALKGLVLPANLKKMEEECFKECLNLKNVEFMSPSKCKIIPNSMFDSCTKLENIQLPEHLVQIGNRAFYRCKSLSSIQLPESLHLIGTEAFYFNGIRELQIPSGLYELGESAFFKCTQLEHVVIPPNVRIIRKWIFHGCNRLKTLEIGYDPEYLGEWIVNRSTTIRCRRGSKIEKYCKEYGYSYVYID